MPDDVIKQFSTIAVLHDHIKLFFGFNDLIELNDIRMPDFLENFYFSSNTFHILLIVDFVLLENLDSDLNYIKEFKTYLLIS